MWAKPAGRRRPYPSLLGVSAAPQNSPFQDRSDRGWMDVKLAVVKCSPSKNLMLVCCECETSCQASEGQPSPGKTWMSESYRQYNKWEWH
jgi:hypothetical protein